MSEDKKKIKSGDDFIVFLKNELEQKKSKNKSYSLRAFARSLDMNAACLSAILNRKRPLTSKMIAKLALKMNLDDQQIESICHKETKSLLYQEIDIEQYALMSEWYHDAIIELIQTKNFRPCIDYIANELGISFEEVKLALERLKKFGYIEISPEKWMIKQPHTNITLNNYTNNALKDYQKKALNFSLEKLETIPPEERFHSTMTMAIDKSKLPQAKEFLRQFRDEFCLNLQKGDQEYDQVYQLNIGFYPISNTKV